ncbi:putative malate dehydrogenase (decarboxylating) [Helianthus anomalus]
MCHMTAECTPEEAFSIVGKNIIFASGSPFKDVDLGGGEIGYSNQGNNMYLFPGSVNGSYLPSLIRKLKI